MTHFLSKSLPPLPDTVITRDGYAFDPRLDEWRIPSLAGTRFYRFDKIAALSAELRHCLKLAMIFFLERKSYSHSSNIWTRFQALYAAELHQSPDPGTVVTLLVISRYRESLTQNTAWYLGVLRVLFNTMEDLGIGICSRDAIEYLNDLRIPGNVKGTAIRTRDPRKGAFNDVELQSIHATLNDWFAAGRISLDDYTLGWLFLAYGSRAIQFAQMKECDLIVKEVDGVRLYALRMPMAKGRGAAYRSQFKLRYCAKPLGELIAHLIEANRQRRAEYAIDVVDPPMLFSEDEGDIPGFPYHRDSCSIAKQFDLLMSRMTNIRANSDRFRKTLLQRAADAGKDIYEIAELAGHRDTQQVKVYTEATLAMTGRLDRAMAMDMAVVAQAFAGVLVEDESERGRDRTSRIYDRSLPEDCNSAMGNCGAMSFCAQSIPTACYTCRHFEPWLDGPHVAFLEVLIADRERMVLAGRSPKIFAIRDRTIVAVAQVIQACIARLASKKRVSKKGRRNDTQCK